MSSENWELNRALDAIFFSDITDSKLPDNPRYIYNTLAEYIDENEYLPNWHPDPFYEYVKLDHEFDPDLVDRIIREAIARNSIVIAVQKQYCKPMQFYAVLRSSDVKPKKQNCILELIKPSVIYDNKELTVQKMEVGNNKVMTRIPLNKLQKIFQCLVILHPSISTFEWKVSITDANFMIHKVPDKDYIIGMRGENVEDFSVYKIKDDSTPCPTSAKYVYDGTAKKCKAMTSTKRGRRDVVKRFRFTTEGWYRVVCSGLNFNLHILHPKYETFEDTKRETVIL